MCSSLGSGADASAPAAIAFVPLSVMREDGGAPTFLAICRLCSQMEVPPQSLHLLLTRLCGQMEVPPQSLHVLLSMEPCASCRGCHPRSIEAATAYASTQGTVWKTSLCRQIVM
jgi:hypothetical protein